MTDANNVDKKDDEITNEGVPVQPVDSERDEAEHRPKSFHVWLRKVIGNFKREGKPVVTPDPKQDRTRALVLLIGGIVGSILLFVGVFSTPPTKSSQAPRGRQPNLGRKDSTAPARLASPTPLLSAQTQSDESGQAPLSATDIQNTSPRHTSGDQRSEEVDSAKSMERRNPVSSPVVRAPAKTSNLVATPVTYKYGAPPDNAGAPGSEVPASFPEAVRSPSAKSSIVFIRSGSGTVGSSTSAVTEGNSDRPAILPPGSRLIARLESAVTSELKVPVVADIEYNYEKGGEILVPAGTKAIGELQQTSTNGFVGIVFHSLQMPDGTGSLTVFAGAATALITTAVFCLTRTTRTYQNAISGPLYLLSGVLVPIQFLPAVLRPLSRVIYLFWSADLLRDSMRPGNPEFVMSRLFAILVLGLIGGAVGGWLLRRMLNNLKRDGTLGLS